MGPTGCGKTSILEAICGLCPLASGEIRLNDVDVTRVPPAARKIGYVPQDRVLFETMTVRQQLAFALEVRRIERRQIDDRVRQVSRDLEISHLLERSTAGLSGGEAQRVALGRALAFSPEFLLLDEPLAALDEATHRRLIELLHRIRHEARITVLHVTHLPAEVETLASIHLRLVDGRVVVQ
jgi:ABC-type sugar transport system ATPase subunit